MSIRSSHGVLHRAQGPRTDPEIVATADVLREPCDRLRPRWGVILGTGLNRLADHLDVILEFDTASLPNFPQPTALGHAGRVVFGCGRGVPVIAIRGRVHIYEGFSPQQVTFSVRLMHELGVSRLIVSNASGGLNPLLLSGDIVIVQDHVDLMGRRSGLPLGAGAPAGVREPGSRVGERSVYDVELMERARRLARRQGVRATLGVYAAMSGPNYETRSEYRFLRRIGADVVGMSTVPETVCAARLGLRTLALSVVTNVCRPDRLGKTDGASVMAAAEAAEPALRELVLSLLVDS